MLITFIFLIVSVFIPAVLADPTVVQVTIDPTKPLPLSTITFNATILCNETIDEVRLLVQECREDLCFVHSFNISMEKIINDTYQAQCALLQEEATQIKYHLQIACNETWYTSNTTFMPLASDTNKNTSQDSHDPMSTPGFEPSVVIVSIVFILIFNHLIRKSNKKP
ncbi:MAG: hypothetical protein NTZ75_07990 [Euryarchaeota archaeon]|nr:hypothetical protein [Euryarchaeota archaeon]